MCTQNFDFFVHSKPQFILFKKSEVWFGAKMKTKTYIATKWFLKKRPKIQNSEDPLTTTLSLYELQPFTCIKQINVKQNKKSKKLVAYASLNSLGVMPWTLLRAISISRPPPLWYNVYCSLYIVPSEGMNWVEKLP